MTSISLTTDTYYMKGFTIVETIVVIFVIAILAALSTIAVGESRARGRDTQRVTDIDTLHSRLEEFRNDYGGYPNTFTAATFPSISQDALVDPYNNSIVINSSVANQVVAMGVANPTINGPNYLYIPYPTGCGAITCTGYILKSYIEKPNSEMLNPYIKTGLSNN